MSQKMGMGMGQFCFHSRDSDKWSLQSWKPCQQNHWQPEEKPFLVIHWSQQLYKWSNNARNGPCS